MRVLTAPTVPAAAIEVRPARRWARLGIALVAIGSLVAGTLMIAAGLKTSTPAAAPLPDREFSLTGPLPTDLATSSAGCDPKPGKSRVVIPRLCVDAPLVSVSIAGRNLSIPHDASIAGIWSAGATLAARTKGTTLLAGHVHMTGQGNGALYSLAKVRPGELVQTYDAAGTMSQWRVSQLRSVHKAELPRNVFRGPRGPRRLVIVTCGGDITQLSNGSRVYADNVIATAVPDG